MFFLNSIANLHLALERVPSSPATLGDSNILNRHPISPPAISPLRGERVKFSSGSVRKVSNGWEDPFTEASGKCTLYLPELLCN